MPATTNRTSIEGTDRASRGRLPWDRTTHPWHAVVVSLAGGGRMALFRATQIILYP
jgi:hypothetical protein